MSHPHISVVYFSTNHIRAVPDSSFVNPAGVVFDDTNLAKAMAVVGETA